MRREGGGEVGGWGGVKWTAPGKTSFKKPSHIRVKKVLILLCQGILEARRIPYLHGPAHFTIHLNSDTKLMNHF